MTQVPSRFWVVRKQGDTVMRFDNPGGWQTIPPEIEEHDAFTIHSIADRAALEATTIDRSNLTDEEYEILGIIPGT